MRRNVQSLLILVLVIALFSCGKNASAPSANNQNAVQESSKMNFVYNNLAEGKDMPNVVVETNKDNVFDLSKTTKPALINFWATWCPPCREEMPGLQELYEEYGNDIDFVLINVGETKETIQDFLVENEFYTFPIGYDLANELSIKFSITAIPTTFIVGKDKKIKNYIIGGRPKEQFRGYIESAIKQ